MAPPSDAQDRRQRVPPSGDSRGGDNGGGARAAVPRDGGDGRSGSGAREAQPAPAPPPPPAAEPQTRSRERGASVDRGDRNDRDDRDRQQAVPRDRDGSNSVRPRVAVPRRDTGGPVYVQPPRRGYYNDRFYYPRGSFGYSYRSGFRPYGLGYFYYDPYVWSSRGVYYYGGPRYGYAAGEVRIDIDQRDAEVYVDGYYAGIVDDFDGVFQSLTLEEGPHRIEVVRPGFAPLEFDVRIRRGDRIHYRGDLRP